MTIFTICRLHRALMVGSDDMHRSLRTSGCRTSALVFVARSFGGWNSYLALHRCWTNMMFHTGRGVISSSRGTFDIPTPVRFSTNSLPSFSLTTISCTHCCAGSSVLHLTHSPRLRTAMSAYTQKVITNLRGSKDNFTDSVIPMPKDLGLQLVFHFPKL